MTELITYIAQSLVEDPSKVVVRETGEKNGAIVYELSVAEGDMGRVIGKQGRIAKAIRSVAKAAASREGKKVIIDIV
ncbi:MAG: KH domain-containing protein [Clostridia bacterium]|nr:KH domain-containing protein [Clostridia bacterium]